MKNGQSWETLEFLYCSTLIIQYIWLQQYNIPLHQPTAYCVWYVITIFCITLHNHNPWPHSITVPHSQSATTFHHTLQSNSSTTLHYIYISLHHTPPQRSGNLYCNMLIHTHSYSHLFTCTHYRTHPYHSTLLTLSHSYSRLYSLIYSPSHSPLLVTLTQPYSPLRACHESRSQHR